MEMNLHESNHEASNCLHELEFWGGPLDGHRELLALPFPTSVCFKSRSVLKRTPWLLRLSRLLYRESSEVFSLSIYELHLVADQPMYVHTKVCVATDQKLRDGEVWLVANWGLK